MWPLIFSSDLVGPQTTSSGPRARWIQTCEEGASCGEAGGQVRTMSGDTRTGCHIPQSGGQKAPPPSLQWKVTFTVLVST